MSLGSEQGDESLVRDRKRAWFKTRNCVSQSTSVCCYVERGKVIIPAGCLKLEEAFREAEMLCRIVYALDMWGPMCHILSGCPEYLSSRPESAA